MIFRTLYLWMGVKEGGTVGRVAPMNDDTEGGAVVDLKGFQEYADSSGLFDKGWAQLDPHEDGFVSPAEADKVLGSTTH